MPKKSTPPGKKLTVFIPEGFTDLQCTQCGDCCRTPPRITISAAKRDRLLRALRDAEFHYAARDAVMRDEDDPDGPATFALVGERCVFLTDEGRCYLCETGVPELRGPWCLSFPVSPIVTPRGVDYAVSFACPETARRLRSKKPLNILALTLSGEQLPAAERAFTARHRIPSVGARPKLDWTAHRLVEGMLLAIARDWRINLTSRLMVMPVMLNHLLRHYAGPGSDAALREQVSRVVRGLGQAVREGRALRPDPEAHYEALASIFGRRTGLRSRATLRRVIESALRQVRGRRTKVKSSELGAALARIYAKRYKPRASQFEHVLGNYVICRTFANAEMLSGGVYKGVYVVCYLVALIRFFAATAAAQRGKRVTQKLLLESVRTTEKLFAQSRNLFDFLDSPDEQRRMLDPAYAAALVRL